MYAVKNGHIDVTKVLLRQDCIDLLVTNKVSKELKQLIYRPNSCLASQKGHTALHIGGCNSQLQCLKEIHAKLAESSAHQLVQVDDSNPYLKTDKVR